MKRAFVKLPPLPRDGSTIQLLADAGVGPGILDRELILLNRHCSLPRSVPNHCMMDDDLAFLRTAQAQKL